MVDPIYSILQSPDDGTSISESLLSEGGIQYAKTEAGVLIFDSTKKKPMDIVYEHPMFEKWDAIISERIKYYTENKTLAGKFANLSYKSMDHFNSRGPNEFLLDIGCGDGAQLQRLKDKTHLHWLGQEYGEA